MRRKGPAEGQPVTPSMWRGAISTLCSAWSTSMKLKVAGDAKGIAIGEGAPGPRIDSSTAGGSSHWGLR